MFSRIATHLVIAAGALGAAGCSTPDFALGEAVKYDMAVQTVNPEPQCDSTCAQPGENGERGTDAVKRYRQDQVEKVEMQTTTSGTSGGGSGGGPR